MSKPKCKHPDNDLDYLSWQEKAGLRHRQGQRQVKCECGSWRWPDVEPKNAEHIKPHYWCLRFQGGAGMKKLEGKEATIKEKNK